MDPVCYALRVRAAVQADVAIAELRAYMAQAHGVVVMPGILSV